MSNDNRGNFSDDDTNGVDRTVDPTIDFGDEFGVVKFAETDDSGPALAFGTNDTEQLPHWTEAPTGEVPRFGKTDDQPTRRIVIGANDGGRDRDNSDNSDVWSAYNEPDPSASAGARRPSFETTTPPPVSSPRREGRIVIGTDPTDERRRPVAASASGPQSRPVSRPASRSSSSRPSARGAQVTRAQRSSSGPSAGRDLPTATAVGALLAAVFIASLMWRPAAVMLLIAILIGVAALEFFTQANVSGYRPSTIIGVVVCVAAPLCAYWIGDAALPLVIVFGFIATVVVFVGSDGIESGPVPNTAIMMLAILWIGLMSSYAALILRFSSANGAAFVNVGTDTLFIVVIGVIANDIAAYFAGTAMGRTPLRDWISPAKSVEGLIGGTIGTFIAVVLVGMQSTTWNSFGDWILLALVISVMAPLGDLAESMFKRNLNVKDFGTVLRGHGGVLDRFDSLLFVLPAAYYLTLVIQPWG
ncbi:MAG: phosphatidate cytidylyltransferase [Actinobacteria bacterium]|nr:phosphatidate cytidylyltransferase [Actinomycetota bacterium]